MKDTLQIFMLRYWLNEITECDRKELLDAVGKRIKESPAGERTLEVIREAYRVRQAQIKEYGS